MKIPYVNLDKQYLAEKKQLNKIFNKVLISGQYVGGEFIDKFEINMAKYCNMNYCVALNSGTDALLMALYSLGVRKGDEVITTQTHLLHLQRS